MLNVLNQVEDAAWVLAFVFLVAAGVTYLAYLCVTKLEDIFDVWDE